MQPIGGMDQGENVDPGANAEAENPVGERKIVKSYCIDAYEDGTYSVSAEGTETEGPAEGEDASAAPAPAEGGENEVSEGGQSLGEKLTAVDACKAFITAEKSRLSGGESDAQGNMDDGFQAQGGGAVHG
jgi:hypothetical protein